MLCCIVMWQEQTCNRRASCYDAWVHFWKLQTDYTALQSWARRAQVRAKQPEQTQGAAPDQARAAAEPGPTPAAPPEPELPPLHQAARAGDAAKVGLLRPRRLPPSCFYM